MNTYRSKCSLRVCAASILLLLVCFVFSASAAQLRFTEATNEVGLIWTHNAIPIDDMASWFGPGIATGDYNRDGFLDLYVVGGLDQPNALFRNDGNGRFTDVTAGAGVGDTAQGRGAAFFDYDNDGWLDLYITNHTANVLYRNNGNGTFADVTAKAGVGDTASSIGFAIGDYDNDGDLDLYVSNWHPHQIGGTPSPNTLYRNNGDSTFTDVTQHAGVGDGGEGMSAIFFDYNGDSWQDLYVANDFGADVLYRNERNGKFADVSDATLGRAFSRFSESMGVCVADYDNDGDFDVYVSDFLVDTLWRNNADGTFTNIAVEAGVNNNEVGWHASFVDFDADGWRDLYVVNGDVVVEKRTNRNRLYRNNGFGGFDEIAGESGALDPVRGRGAACGDFDLDGDIDIVIGRHNGELAYFRNNSPPGGNWLSVELSGRASNRDGIGAKVYVTAGDRAQVAERQGNTGYAGQDAPQLLFGIGETNQVDVRVEWPASGIVQTWKDIPVNQRLRIDEHAGLSRRVDIVAVEPLGKQPVMFGAIKAAKLLQNYPNPFNPETWIPFVLTEPSSTSIEIFDLQGRRIHKLDLGLQPSQTKITVYWEGKNETGEAVASGVYFYGLRVGNEIKSVKQMTLLK